MKRTLFLLTILASVALGLAGFVLSAAAVTLTPGDIDWQTVGTDVVRFHLRFHNNDPLVPSPPILGAKLYSQEFGVFLPHYGTIGTFDIPPIEPESFFDVFFEVPLSSLPPGPLLQPGLAARGPQEVICPPPIWAGNVDVIWMEPGGPAQVNKHYGNVGVCPGGPATCLHVLTGCPQNLTWAVRNVCPGWNVTLLNEDLSPAPALLPPGWTGYICVTAGANIPINAMCCFAVDFICAGVTGTIDVCAYACDCPVPATKGTWGRIKTLYR